MQHALACRSLLWAGRLWTARPINVWIFPPPLSEVLGILPGQTCKSIYFPFLCSYWQVSSADARRRYYRNLANVMFETLSTFGNITTWASAFMMFLRLFLAFRNITRLVFILYVPWHRKSLSTLWDECQSLILPSETSHWLAFYNNCISYQLEAIVSTCMEREFSGLMRLGRETAQNFQE